MKPFFLAITLTLICFLSSSAQLEKGTWIGSIGGSFTTDLSNSSYSKSWQVNLNPQVMKLLSKNLAIGASTNFGIGNLKTEYNDGYENFNYTFRYTYLEVGPVARYYFGSFRLKPFADLGMGLQMNHRFDNSQYGENGTYWDFYARPAAGIAWWINDKVSLNLSTGFTFLNLKEAYFDGVKIGVSFIFGSTGARQ